MLSRVAAGESATRRAIERLKRYRTAVLHAAVTGELTSEWRKTHKPDETGAQLLKRLLRERRARWEEAERKRLQAADKPPKDDKWKKRYREPTAPNTAQLPPIPKVWAWCLSDAVFSFITSGSRGWAKFYSDKGSLFLRIGNLEHENIKLDLSKIQYVTPPAKTEGVRTLVQPNDILISITADVGMVGLVPEGLGRAYINQHIALARRTVISASYISYYLCGSEGGWGQFNSSAG